MKFSPLPEIGDIEVVDPVAYVVLSTQFQVPKGNFDYPSFKSVKKMGKILPLPGIGDIERCHETSF